MAYDSYHDSPTGYSTSVPLPYDQSPTSERPYTTPGYPSVQSPPYPSQYITDQIQMPQARMPSPQPPSPTKTLPSQGQQLNDAVASAVHDANTSNFLSPELISQVTATVIQQLKAYGLDNQPSQQPAPPASATVYPSAYPQSAPPPQPQQTSTPPPPLQKPPTFPQTDVTYQDSPQSTRKNASRPESRADQRKPIIEKRSEPVPESRPVQNDRIPTEEGMTTLEKIWGKMFDNGRPTARLGQLLRGIAVHLIENYPPGDTMVVVPEKMQKYYADTKVSLDTYPWNDIFDDQTSSISRIYRDIEAEHHLVQDPSNFKERPCVPGLTPRGFERWYTLMLQANPEREFARLQKTVLDMPISNPDDKKERFPKELPRRLFPSAPDLTLLEKLEVSIVTHCEVDLPREKPDEQQDVQPKRSSTDKSPSRASTLTQKPAPSVDHREAHTYSSAANTAAVGNDNDDNGAAAAAVPLRPIERERKPYSAQPGGGKRYEEVADSGSKGDKVKAKDHLTSPTTTSHRASVSYAADANQLRSGPGAGGSYDGHNQHASISSKSGRSRSGSVGVNGKNDYRHSDSDLNIYEPEYLTGGSSHYRTSSTAGDGYDEGRRYRDYDRADARDYEVLRERERERERRYHEPVGSRSSWSEEDYYRGLLGGQGSEYKYR